MVKVQKPSDYDELDQIVRRLCESLGLLVDVEGWTRKTYHVFTREPTRKRVRLARIESSATTNGEIRICDDRAMPFAEALGKELERAFALPEAVILREAPPS